MHNPVRSQTEEEHRDKTTFIHVVRSILKPLQQHSAYIDVFIIYIDNNTRQTDRNRMTFMRSTTNMLHVLFAHLATLFECGVDLVDLAVDAFDRGFLQRSDELQFRLSLVYEVDLRIECHALLQKK